MYICIWTLLWKWIFDLMDNNNFFRSKSLSDAELLGLHAVMFYWVNNSLYQSKSYGQLNACVSGPKIFPKFHWKQLPECGGQWEGQGFPLDNYNAVSSGVFKVFWFSFFIRMWEQLWEVSVGSLFSQWEKWISVH